MSPMKKNFVRLLAIVPIFWLLACSNGIELSGNTGGGGHDEAPSGSQDHSPNKPNDPKPANQTEDATNSDDAMEESISSGRDYPPITDPTAYADVGPCGEVSVDSNTGPGNNFTLFRPANMESNQFLHPVVTWGNGTGGTPGVYSGILRHLASHCFVVIASNSTSTGTGQEMIQGALWMIEQEARQSFGDGLRASQLGVSGHSQGGGGTMNVAGSSEVDVKAVIGVQPDCVFTSNCSTLQQITAPTFLYTGGSDRLVRDNAVANGIYPSLNSVSNLFYAMQLGAGHFEPVSQNPPPLAAHMVGFFRAFLMNDATAQAEFSGSSCTLCNSNAWEVKEFLRP